MAFIVADRVREVSASIGTGVFNLSGSPIGYQTFSASVGNGNTTYYVISNPGVNEWEVGIGTVGAGTLTRTTILASSNGGTAVNFTAGSKDVFVTYPAEAAVFADNTVTLTNKTFGDNPVFSAGTANGVAYLNGSKVLTTGSALTFDGSIIDTNVSGSTALRLTSSTAQAYISLTSATAGSAPFIGFNNGTGALGSIAAISGGGLSFASGNTERMRLDSSGNLGLGVTPSAWFNGKHLQFPYGAVGSNANGYPELLNNAYESSNNVYTYLHSGLGACKYTQSFGEHLWFSAPSGTAGNAISFTQPMTLSASGNLGIGTSSPGERLNVVGGGSTSSTVNFTGGSNNDNATIASDYGLFFQVDANNNIGGRDFNWRVGGKGYSDGTSLMTLNSSGNLGLGVTPSAWGQGKAFEVGYTGNSVYGYDASNIFLLQNAYYNGEWKYAASGGATMYAQQSGFHNWRIAPSGTAGNAISFTQAMTLDASGNLLVGTTVVPSINNTSGAYIYGSGQAQFFQSNADALILNRLSSAGSIALFRQGSNGVVGGISVTTTSTAFLTSSDYRLKENIQPMQNALGVVAQLNPVTYNWKADGSDGQGFIAHELQAVVPDCVTGEKDAVDKDGNPVYQGIDTSFLVATLCKAIQEQQDQINQLTARVAQLEGN